MIADNRSWCKNATGWPHGWPTIPLASEWCYNQCKTHPKPISLCSERPGLRSSLFLSSKIYHSIILACNGVVNHSLLLKWYNFPLDHMHVWLSGKLYHLTPLVTSSLTRQNKKKTFIKFGSKILSVFPFPFHLILPLFIPGLKWNCNCLVHTPPICLVQMLAESFHHDDSIQTQDFMSSSLLSPSIQYLSMLARSINWYDAQYSAVSIVNES